MECTMNANSKAKRVYIAFKDNTTSTCCQPQDMYTKNSDTEADQLTPSCCRCLSLDFSQIGLVEADNSGDGCAVMMLAVSGLAATLLQPFP